MAYEKMRFEIKGVSPLLMHNGLLLDPDYIWTQELAKLTSKRKKSLELHQQIARTEWRGGLYEADGKVVVPGVNLEAMIVDAAATCRQKQNAQAGVLVEEDSVLRFSGEKRSIDELREDKNFRLRVRVALGNKAVMRTRPRFADWGLTFVVSHLPQTAGAADVREWVGIAAGKGLGDWTPRYGRFVVVVDGVPA